MLLVVPLEVADPTRFSLELAASVITDFSQCHAYSFYACF